MSLRWRASGILLCAAKYGPLEDDTYIDDRLHYKLSVELKVVIPQDDEPKSGVWHWIESETAKRIMEEIIKNHPTNSDLSSKE